MSIFSVLLLFLVLDLFWILVGLILAHFDKTHRYGIRLLAMSYLATGLAPYVCTDKMSVKCGTCGNWTCPLFCYRPKEVKNESSE